MFALLFESPQIKNPQSYLGIKITKHSYRAPTVLQVSSDLFYTKTQRSEH